MRKYIFYIYLFPFSKHVFICTSSTRAQGRLIVCLSVCLCVCLSVRLSVCASVCLSVCLSRTDVVFFAQCSCSVAKAPQDLASLHYCGRPAACCCRYEMSSSCVGLLVLFAPTDFVHIHFFRFSLGARTLQQLHKLMCSPPLSQ